ncbi:MAG: hypothetical protein JO357_08260 [Hyphomicrobiales bacterium]|nr:hypothetical protein [Hyphomicrobiales bacterium]MBV9752552.1 hypothetical protein [Hyphomicrobiales bacterium]
MHLPVTVPPPGPGWMNTLTRNGSAVAGRFVFGGRSSFGQLHYAITSFFTLVGM